MTASFLPYQNANNTFPAPVTFYDSATFQGAVVNSSTVVNAGGSVTSGGETISGGLTVDSATVATTVSAGGLVTGAGIVTTAGQQINTRLVTAAGTAVVTTSDGIVSINKSVGAATAVSLYATPLTGDYVVIKDAKGDAGANNITITPAAGNIDNAGTLVISTNKGAVRLAYDGTQWISV